VAATLVFDIETVPDVAGYRTLLDLDDSPPTRTSRRRHSAATRGDRQEFCRCTCSASWRSRACCARARACAHGPRHAEDGEGELIQRFYDGVEKYKPQLISWNGGGFDLPVLHYRGLRHGVTAPRYWDMGEGDYADSRDFRFNNYINRYHTRHLDLMDLLAMFQPRASAPLDQVARLVGLPGKLGMDGSQVWDAFRAGRIADVRAYCETDTLNTWLVYLRFQLMRGALDRAEYAAELALARATLGKLDAPHWREFLAAWPQG
jgi:predicted PolB exonuclease-like 3'-5' exonuclease